MHPDISQAAKDQILDWMFSHDTGLSSEALASFFLGKQHDKSYPLDPGDFGRCYRLLRRVPELREHISEASAISPSWKALTEAWEELEELYLQCCNAEGRYEWEKNKTVAKRMYERMRELTSKPSRDEGWIHLKDVSIKVGA